MTFALVTEGISEHKIIKQILSKYFKDQDPDINQMQPRLTDDEKKQEDGSIGGWVEVLKYCEDENELNSIFNENEYLVIQIDTDMCEVFPFSVSQQNKNDSELHCDIVERLKKAIPHNIKERYIDKIIFAISINTIECWLLPLFYQDDVHRCKTTNCLRHLNTALERNNMHIISTIGNKNDFNSQRAYGEILQKIRRSHDVEDCSQYNFGFRMFVSQLDIIKQSQILNLISSIQEPPENNQ